MNASFTIDSFCMLKWPNVSVFRQDLIMEVKRNGV